MKRGCNDLAYTAGIVDGEGTITFAKWKKRRGCRHQILEVLVRVSNTNEWLIRWLQFSFGGTAGPTTVSGKRKTLWRWEIRTRAAVSFLEVILPYLRLKKPQAELAIQFGKARTARGKHKTDEQLAVEEAQLMLMRQYNKRGKEVLS